MTSQATWKVIAADMPIGTTPTANGASRRSPRATGRRAAASSRPARYEDVPQRVGLPGNRPAFTWVNGHLGQGRTAERERGGGKHCNTEATCQGCFDDASTIGRSAPREVVSEASMTKLPCAL